MKAPIPESDDALWQAASTDPEAFGLIFERHARAVFAFCLSRTRNRAQAEDATSSVFLEAWRKRHAIKLEDQSALPYLLGIANNVTRNADRSLRRYRKALQRLTPPLADQVTEDDIVARIDSERAVEEALAALDTLSPAERDAFVLVSWSGLTYNQAAAALGITEPSLRSHLWRARQKLTAFTSDRLALPLSRSL